MDRRIGTLVRGATLLVAVTAGACAPVLSHGPRVEEGTSLGASVAVLSIAGESGSATNAVIPYLKSGERYDDGTARQFTVQLVIPEERLDDDGILHGMQFDYYREAASDEPSVAKGGGVLVGLGQVMPYGQWGLYRGRTGFYTTQGFGVVGTYFGVPPEAFFWSPGVGVEYRGDGFRLRGNVQSALLWVIDQRRLNTNAPIALGITFEVGGGSATPP